MHLFAFPWKGYDTSRNFGDPLAAPGTGFSGPTPRYQGGPFGLLAILDAFNPWDIIKASARGFRWLFVGRKKRFEDVSYAGTPSKPKNNGLTAGGLTPTSYTGPSYAGAGDLPTELRSSDDGRRGRADTHPTDSDTAGLLSHAGGISPNRSHSFAQGSDIDPNDLGHGTALHHDYPIPPMPSAYGGYDDGRGHMDTSYHGVSDTHAAVGTAHGGGGGGQNPQWDMWAGAHRPADDDQNSIRPPTYRTTDNR